MSFLCTWNWKPPPFVVVILEIYFRSRQSKYTEHWAELPCSSKPPIRMIHTKNCLGRYVCGRHESWSIDYMFILSYIWCMLSSVDSNHERVWWFDALSNVSLLCRLHIWVDISEYSTVMCGFVWFLSWIYFVITYRVYSVIVCCLIFFLCYFFILFKDYVRFGFVWHSLWVWLGARSIQNGWCGISWVSKWPRPGWYFTSLSRTIIPAEGMMRLSGLNLCKWMVIFCQF